MEIPDKTRYESVLERLERACAQSGRKRTDVCLVAVSKFHPVEKIAAIAALGQKDFGENYQQEAQEKMARLPELRWHFTGRIQSRKAAKIAGNFVLLHTLDSIKLADALEKSLAQKNLRQKALLEANLGAEPQKAGVLSENLPSLMEHVLEKCPHLEIEGLMCLPPVFDAGEASRPYFARLRELRDNLEGGFGRKLPELSMGMSGDFEWAVMEGATIVRVGTDIFGERPARSKGSSQV